MTLIGPHVGESIILHYQGKWLLIDSCLDSASKEPAAFEYLTMLGVAANQVSVVACTHWHDDHFKGLSKLYAAYPGAAFWMSLALGRREFFEVVEAWRGWPTGAEPHTSGLEELTACIDIARRRSAAPNFAGPDQRLWMSADGNAELWSLSPSSEMIVKGLTDVAKLLPADWSIKSAAADSRPNNTSVAMHFRAGAHGILLGSDLEEVGSANSGWSSIVGSTTRPRLKAGLFKVAHHGSETGHHAGIPTDLLNVQPVSIMTPFTRSSLPRDADVARIKAYSGQAFISARRAVASVRRSGVVQKRIKANNLRVSSGAAGLVRCRVDAADPTAAWRVELYDSAMQL